MESVNKWKLINYLISENNFKNYLEIGLNNPNNNFNHIICENKESCDPYLNCIDLVSEVVNGNVGNFNNVNDNISEYIETEIELPDFIKECLTYHMTSDVMFESIPEDKKWDIILIDGLHEYSQVGRDIINSIKHLNRGGYILLHDCIPFTKESQIYPRKKFGDVWNGNVWKVVPQLQYKGIDYNIVNTDYGVCVLQYNGNVNDLDEFTDISMLYEEYKENPNNIHNLISVDDFYKKYRVEKEIKTAVCCLVKMENLYLRDYVEYYKNLGVDNIILYDNNDKTGEYPQQVIGDYISNGYVIYKNIRGEILPQTKTYNECINEFGKKFDWICFFDCDEFLTFTNDENIKTYLKRDCFINTLSISINWLNYDDNDNLYYENKPVYERFSRVCDQTKTDNHLKKLIVHTSLDDVFTFDTPCTFRYTMVNGSDLKYNNGDIISDSYWWYINHDLAYLRHYKYMSITEFLTRRLGRRSYACEDPYDEDMIIGMFREANEMTTEKEKIIKDFLELY